MRYFLILFLFGTFSCQTKNSPTNHLSFYHWKQQFSPAPYVLNRLNDHQVERLYIRYFDVDLQGGRAVPISVVELSEASLKNYEVVPVIFITNRTLQQVDAAEGATLADKILSKVMQMSEDLNSPVPMIQVDCDWSGSTKDAYFSLLKQMRETLHKKEVRLSATIRLHQIKYFDRTGVPPVDRGVLMFYNTGKVNDYETENSILDLHTAGQYLNNFDRYPLALDLALPLFRWGVVFQEERFVRLINGLHTRQLQDTSTFLKVGENNFELLKSTYLEGYYLYAGDQIRVEQIAPDTLSQAAKLLVDVLKPEDRTLIFYHLDSTLIADYPHEILETIYHTFD